MMTQEKPEMSNPFKKLMTSMMVGTAVEFQHKVMGLIKEYEEKGIESISIKVLQQMIFESSVKTMAEDGLAGSYLQTMMEEK